MTGETPNTEKTGAGTDAGTEESRGPADTSASGGETPEGSSASGGPTAAGGEGAPKKKRRRGKRGGKRHRKKPASAGTATAEGGASSEGAETPPADPEKKASPTRARAGGSGGARTRSRPAKAPASQAGSAPPVESSSAPDAAADAEPGGEDTGEGAPRTRRRRGKRGGRGRGKKTPAADATAEEPEKKKQPTGRAKSAAKPAARSGGGESTRLRARAQRRGQRPRRPRKKLSEEEAAQLRGQAKTMLIHEHDDRTQIAVLEEGTLIEHYVARVGQKTTMAGNVFMGKVQNVLPGMEAAFVDFGRGRNGVLYAGEVNYSAEDIEGDKPRRIEHVLKSGQKIMVQVTKDPIGNKGARLTTQVSLAGRYLVLAPEQQLTGISRRLAENERNRLRQILRDIRPDGHGVIVRTAAEGASKEALKRDLDHLVNTWETIQKGSKRAKAPSQLYSEPDLIMRVVRDEFSEDFTSLVVDTRDTYEAVKSYLEDTAPELLPKLELHEGALPLFEEHRVTEQLHKALERKVWLPSGGSIIIERTEALTVIDVNTGKFTGKGSTLEETVFANNLEAAEEIARQLRLRDIGGIIVIDFIDMIEQKNQRELLRTFKRALSKDKTRSQVFEVSNLGLVEMTRKKVSEGLLDAFSEPCPNCEGRGIVITHEID